MREIPATVADPESGGAAHGGAGAQPSQVDGRPAPCGACRHEAMPAVEQVKFDRNPVFPVPRRGVTGRRVTQQFHPVWRDVVDVFLDHDLDEDDDSNGTASKKGKAAVSSKKKLRFGNYFP